MKEEGEEFMLSRTTVFTDGWRMKPEYSFDPLFKAILYSVSRVRTLVNSAYTGQRLGALFTKLGC